MGGKIFYFSCGNFSAAAFFLSVLKDDATKQNEFINMVYIGVAFLVTSLLTLGTGGKKKK